jgi:predicted alpha/beta hydrolase
MCGADGLLGSLTVSAKLQGHTNLSVVETPIQFAARDGFDLGGILYAPTADADPACAVVLSCGGGIPAARYANFARYLARAGVPVLTYDYRGIGRSRPASLRGFSATIEDWSEYDCGGAIDWLRARYRTSVIVGVAHSIGAFLMGGAPNLALLSRVLFVGAHTGYFGDYRPLFRWPMAIVWHGAMPVLTHALGYFPGHRLGLGEDIPRDIALRWAARRTADPKAPSALPKDSTRSDAFFRRCELASGTALMLGFTDDAFATPAGMRRFLREFPRINAISLEVAPKQVGLKQIGHFGFFSRRVGAVLWPRVVQYVTSGIPPELPSVLGRPRP